MTLTVVAHCCLNPGVRLRGYQGKKLDLKGNIIQLPCPEILYFGPLRWEVTKEQLDFPMYRRFCREVFIPVADILDQHKDEDITIMGMPRSPSCAAEVTTVGYQGGRVRETEHKHICGMGIFFEEIERELKERGIVARFIDV